MSRTRAFGALALALAFAWAVMLWAPAASLWVLFLPPMVLLGILASRWRRRPERAALVLATGVVVAGLALSMVHVAHGITEDRVWYTGTIDAREVLTPMYPSGRYGDNDPIPGLDRDGFTHMTSGTATATVPHAGSSLLIVWSAQEIAPWLLAALALVLLLPLFRAARRDDPFSLDAGRLAVMGLLLFVGIPTLELLRFAVAMYAQGRDTMASPIVEPALGITPLHLLPGLLVLVLAGVFRQGGELRDLDRHTV
jgi:hypothetical protein